MNIHLTVSCEYPFTGGIKNLMHQTRPKIYQTRPKIWIIVFIAIIIVVGVWMTANKKLHKDDNIYHLDFFEIDNEELENLDNISDNIRIIKEIIIDQKCSAFIFTDNENGEYKGAFGSNGESYYIGQVSMENTTADLMGIKEVQVFGKRAVKFYGVLGANYAQAFYWFYEENIEDSIIRIDGNTIEIDLDDDDRNEIIATMGTIPETSIYTMKEAKILVSNINKSINAKSVSLSDESSNLFEVYFEPNKLELFEYQDDVLIKK